MNFTRSAITELPDGSFECIIRVCAPTDLLALARIPRFDAGGSLAVKVHEDPADDHSAESQSAGQVHAADPEKPAAQTIGATAGDTLQTLSDVAAGRVDQHEVMVSIMLREPDFMAHARMVVEAAGLLTPFINTPSQILSLYLVHVSAGAPSNDARREMQIAAIRTWIIKNRPSMQSWG